MLIAYGLPAFRHGIVVISLTRWAPGQGEFGAGGPVLASLAVGLFAVAVAWPLGVGSGVALQELASRRGRVPWELALRLLASVPSVVYGLVGLWLLAPVLGVSVAAAGAWSSLRSVLVAGIALAAMITPLVAVRTAELLREVPGWLREGARAVGATRWQAIRRVVLPVIRPGLLGAGLYGLSRALGETTVVFMITGVGMTEGLQPMVSAIAGGLVAGASEPHLGALAQIALLLGTLTLILHGTSRLLIARCRAQLAELALHSGGSRDDPGFALKGEAAGTRAGAPYPPGERLLTGAAVLSLVPLAAVAATALAWGIAALLREPWKHLSSLGTGICIGLAALALAAPVGMAVGLFVAEYRESRLVAATQAAIDWLGSMPSAVAGMLAYLLIGRNGTWATQAAVAAVALVVLPRLARAVEESLRRTPGNLREAALALGIPRWRVVTQLVARTASPRLWAAILSAAAWAVTATAPILLAAPAHPQPALAVDLLRQGMAAAAAGPEGLAAARPEVWSGALVLLMLALPLGALGWAVERRGSHDRPSREGTEPA